MPSVITIDFGDNGPKMEFVLPDGAHRHNIIQRIWDEAMTATAVYPDGTRQNLGMCGK